MELKYDRIIHFLTIIILSSAFASSVVCQLRPGDLDPTFSGDGKLTDFIPDQNWNYFAATVVQPDGNIVAVGGTSSPRYIYVVRYKPDGSPDTTFGGGSGKVKIQFGVFYNYVSDVALQADGKIVIAGCYCEEDIGDYTLALARLNSDGSMDASFGFNGVLTRPDIRGPANSVAIQTDGRIVIAGQAGFYLDWLVARFNSNGSPDATFNGNGLLVTPGLGGPYSVALQTDGKIVAAGESHYFSPLGDFAIVRYAQNGSLDTTFGGDGIVTTQIGQGRDVAQSVAIQTDGKIVAAGSSDREGPNFTVVRYGPNGSLDLTFDGDGIVNTAIDVEAEASSIAIQSDGKLVAAGTSDNGANNDFALVRYTSNGSLDTTFGGGDGKATADFDSSDDSGYGMALDNLGRAVVVGRSNERVAIARFVLGSGSTRFDYDGDGKSDFSVWRQQNDTAPPTWYIAESGSGQMRVSPFVVNEVILPADYDGDGKTDIAAAEAALGGAYDHMIWYVLSPTGLQELGSVGKIGDYLLPADYDGDGDADIAAWRPSEGTWYLSGRPVGQIPVQQWGLPGDKPVPADFDGDGKTDLAVWRPSEGRWYVRNLANDSITVIEWGLPGDIPVVGDYSGDGKADYAVYRPSNNTWYRMYSSDFSMHIQTWGLPDDIVTPGDYDGDGKLDLAVWRPSDAKWYVLTATNTIITSTFGLTGDVPTPSAYVY